MELNNLLKHIVYDHVNNFKYHFRPEVFKNQRSLSYHDFVYRYFF